MFESIKKFIREAKSVIKSILLGDWIRCSLGATDATPVEEVMTAESGSFYWDKWFKGEYRQVQTRGFDGLSNMVIGYFFGAMTCWFVAPAFAFLGVFGIFPTMFMGILVCRTVQAIQLRYQMDVRNARDFMNAAV